jgi:iron complex outermembrane receptor protein
MAPGKINMPLYSTRFDVRMGYKNFEFQFKAQDYEKGSPFPAFCITDGFFEADKSYIGQAIYQRNVNDKLSFTLKGNYYYRKHNLHGEAYPDGIFGPLLPGFGAQGFFSEGIQGDLTIKSQSFGFQSQFNYTLNEKNTLTLGVEYTNLTTDKPGVLSNMDPITRTQTNQLVSLQGASFGFMERSADRDVIAAFIQDSWQVAERLNITAGLRIDHYSEFGNTVNPRISLIWKILDNTNVKLLYGHAFRAPVFNELYSIYAAQVGNENLGPEKVRSFEIGINHKFSNNINANLNYFYNTIRDMILPSGKIVIETYPPQLENSGKVTAQGIEAEIKANFEKNTYAYFNYSYAKAKDELTGEVVPNVANNLFNFGINVGVWKYLNAHLNVNYVGKRNRGLLMGFPDPRDPVNAYSLSNFTIRAQNFWKDTEIVLSIHNLLDTEYVDPEPLGTIYYDFPREGRQIIGKVIFKF